MHTSAEGFVVPVRSTEVLRLTGMLPKCEPMLSFHSGVSGEGRLVGAEPELWSITSVITMAATHRPKMKG